MLSLAISKTKMAKVFKCFFDGSANPNPGQIGLGVVFYDQEGVEVLSASANAGVGTNNSAEYKALIWAMELALKEGFIDVHYFCDSQLVTNQVMGRWEVNNADLKAHHIEVQRLLCQFNWCKVEWLERRFNARADQLSKEGATLPSPVIIRKSNGASDSESCKVLTMAGADGHQVRQQSLFDESISCVGVSNDQKRFVKEAKSRSVVVRGLKGNKVAFIYSNEVVVFDIRNKHCSCHEFLMLGSCEHADAIKAASKVS